jgi:hypothetical protein
MLRIHHASVPALLIAAVLGCNSGRAIVQGTVTVNGEAVESGMISFIPVAGQGVSAGTDIEHGRFGLRTGGLPPGDYRVEIHAFRGTGKKTWNGMGEPNAPVSQKHYVEETEQYIPAKYNDSTELIATIVASKANELKFDLQAPARKPK